MTDEPTKRTQISKIMASAKLRAGHKKIDFDLTLDYLVAIAPDNCPVFKEPLKWGVGTKEKTGTWDYTSPSLDRVLPDKGYVKGNVAWISMRANMIKSNVTAKELYAVADWLHQVTKEIEKYGGVLPPRYDDPAFTHTQRPANFVIDTSKDARQRGGY